jgi:hypothetical protein
MNEGSREMGLPRERLDGDGPGVLGISRAETLFFLVARRNPLEGECGGDPGD